jgi:hypothetical protein
MAYLTKNNEPLTMVLRQAGRSASLDAFCVNLSSVLRVKCSAKKAAGIDVGSRSHFVAIGQTDEDVRAFGVYNEDLLHQPNG